MMRRGFSLVELSIVLVILGLLVGGLLAGKSLIRASELRAVGTEYSRWITAGHAFKDKYFGLPGDLSNATSFWGKDNASCTSHTGTTTTPGTCNGDGDGAIETGIAGATTEAFRFWQQLALAGLIEGSYSGNSGAGGGVHVTLGVNAPASKLSGAGWNIRHISGYYAGNSTAYATTYGSFFDFGGPLTNNSTYASIMKPEETWNIDTKIDDGLPGLGKMIVYQWNNGCAQGGASETDLTNSVYNLDSSGVVCSAIFVRLFGTS